MKWITPKTLSTVGMFLVLAGCGLFIRSRQIIRGKVVFESTNTEYRWMYVLGVVATIAGVLMGVLGLYME